MGWSSGSRRLLLGLCLSLAEYSCWAGRWEWEWERDKFSRRSLDSSASFLSRAELWLSVWRRMFLKKVVFGLGALGARELVTKA